MRESGVESECWKPMYGGPEAFCSAPDFAIWTIYIDQGGKMLYRSCGHKTISLKRWRRILDNFFHGHSLHTCGILRQFFGDHYGNHVCGCGVQWSKQIPTMNGLEVTHHIKDEW